MENGLSNSFKRSLKISLRSPKRNLKKNPGHDIHENKPQICPVKEHPCCYNMRGKQNYVHFQDLTNIDFNLIPQSTIQNSVKLNYGVNGTTPIIFLQ